MENNVVEQNKNKNLIIWVMACIIVLLIAALVYFVFIRKDKSEEPPKPQDNGQVDLSDRKFTKFEKIKIGTDNKEIAINNKKLNLKVVDDILYINDENTNIKVYKYFENDSDVGVTDVGVSDYLMFFYEPAQGGDWVSLVLDDSGKKVPFDKSLVENNDDLEAFPVVDIYVENEKLMGRQNGLTFMEGTFPGNIYEMKYDGKKITVELKIGEMQLNSNNRQFVLNGKSYNLKMIDTYLYINDVKQENVQFEENVFVADKYILVEQVGQCGRAISYAVNENGKVIKVEKKITTNGDNKDYQVQNIRYENGKIIGEMPTNCYCYESFDGECSVGFKNIEFSYDVDKITINEIGK